MHNGIYQITSLTHKVSATSLSSYTFSTVIMSLIHHKCIT